MPTNLRLATFNVENLFSRPKLMNLQRHDVGDNHLRNLGNLRRELRRTQYDKPEILRLYRSLRNYIKVVEVRNKLLNRQRNRVLPDGRRAWDGWIELKRDEFNQDAVRNTGWVIRNVNADIMCVVEVESRPVLKRFASQRLGTRYSYNRLVDGNDNRGIDVGLLSKLEPMGMWTHIDDKQGSSRIFSRDCLEVRLTHRAGFDVWVLLNHFKSKGYGAQNTSNARRRGQAERVAEILSEYNLRRDYVVVAGDLNDTPNSAPLAPLMGVADLYDVLEEVFPDPADRWTYHYRRNEQIDYLLVSRPLQRALQDAGVQRRGIFDVETYSNNTIRSINTVTNSADAASDHGAVWADFRIP